MNGWGLAPVSGSRDAGNERQYKQRRKLLLTARSSSGSAGEQAQLDDATQQDRLQFHELNGRFRLNPDWRSWDALRSLRSI